MARRWTDRPDWATDATVSDSARDFRRRSRQDTSPANEDDDAGSIDGDWAAATTTTHNLALRHGTDEPNARQAAWMVSLEANTQLTMRTLDWLFDDPHHRRPTTPRTSPTPGPYLSDILCTRAFGTARDADNVRDALAADSENFVPDSQISNTPEHTEHAQSSYHPSTLNAYRQVFIKGIDAYTHRLAANIRDPQHHPLPHAPLLVIIG